MAEAPIAGAANIYVNGQSYPLRGEFTYQVSVDKNETVAGLDGVHGRKRTPMPGQIKAKFTNTAGLDVAALCFPDRIVADLSNGKTVTGSNMWNTDQPSVNVDEGTAEFTWEGRDVSEFSS